MHRGRILLNYSLILFVTAQGRNLDGVFVNFVHVQPAQRCQVENEGG